MKRIGWSLFTKFAVGIGFIVILFGLLNAILVRNSVSQALNDEFEKRGYFISRALAEQSVSYMLSNDPAGLNMLINEIMAIDPTIHYAFILDNQGNVLAHSFREKVPDDLIKKNTPPADDLPGIINIVDKNEPHMLIRDFSMATMSKSMGVARVGILENDIRDQVTDTLASLWVMVAFFFLLGITAALLFSYTISTPLKVLSRQSAIIAIENIQAGLWEIREATRKPYYRVRRLFGLTDEIDVLFENYSNMLSRLEQAYHDMNKMQQSLFHSEKLASIGTLTAGVAHEINNPLTGISTGLKRIEKDPANKEQIVEYTAMMQESLGKMQKVINDLLTFSRKDDSHFEKVNALNLVRKTVQLAQYRVKANNITISVDAKNPNIELYVSPSRIEQVFLNIIINAIDATAEKISHQPELHGYINIHIEDDADHIYVIVKDNGQGISRDCISKIFDPFFTTKNVGDGTGLGLSVSYQIVKDHGGMIQVESSPDEGSRFCVRLPKQA